MRRRGNLDSNHPEIVEALEGIGASVTSLANLGEGVPDLLVGFRGRNRLLEVKDGRKPPSKRKARPEQEKFAVRWKGEPPCLVRNVEEAIEATTADVVPARLLLDPTPALMRAARGRGDDHAKHVRAYEAYLAGSGPTVRGRVLG